jgi:pimeloyl-ACP methyl ester carboxylesterase
LIRLSRFAGLAFAGVLVFGTPGCGTYMAHRLAQAPNTYPTWFAPKARVTLGFSPKMLNNFAPRYVEVGPPKAKLFYRVVDPANYDLRVSSTNWMRAGKRETEFSFRATIPGPTNQWTSAPRGTVVLLHGYGLAQFAMAPWAMRLGQEGWRCVLVDLRGHGKSTGRKVFFGVRETRDLSQLLDQLARDGQLAGPVSVMGESYGAALALRWKAVDPRVQSVVAIAPYAVLSNAVLNIARDYAGWMPEFVIRAGLKKLPSVLKVQPGDLDTETVMRESPVSALFVAGTDDRIMPLAEVEGLRKLTGQGSELIVVPDATHETVTYYFKDLAVPVLEWLGKKSQAAVGAGVGANGVLPSPSQASLFK